MTYHGQRLFASVRSGIAGQYQHIVRRGACRSAIGFGLGIYKISSRHVYLFLKFSISEEKEEDGPYFQWFLMLWYDQGRVVVSSTTLCISSIQRRRRESFTCKQKQHTQLRIKRSSPLYPHGSIWYSRHDDTNHGPHHQQTPLVEATSSPPHEFSGAKAGFLTWADKLFACTTPGLGSRLSQSIEYGGGPSRSRILPCRFSNVARSLAAHP